MSVKPSGDRGEGARRRTRLAGVVATPANDDAARDRDEGIRGRVAWPNWFSPQQASVLSVLTAQLWNWPAERALKLPVGEASWPLPLLPQQVSEPSPFSAQLWKAPAEITLKVPAGEVAWP
jgi:hypothetical protein